MDYKKFVIPGLIGLVMLLAGLYLGSEMSKPIAFGGLVQNVNPIFTNGLRAGISAVQVIDETGKITIAGGTEIAEHKCATATWNPAGVSSTVMATTSVTITGAALGDIAVASFDSATSTDQWNIHGIVSAADTVMVSLEKQTVGALDLSTSTARACYFGY